MQTLLLEPIILTPTNPPKHSTNNLTKPLTNSSLKPSNPTHHNTLLKNPPTTTTYASVLDSCASLTFGKQLHAHSLKSGFCGHGFVQTKLLQMYARNGSLDDACQLFDTMPLRNSHAWTAILRVHVDLGLLQEAYQLSEELIREPACTPLDFFVFPVVLNICCGLGELELGIQLHGMLVKQGFVANVYVCNALIDMYGKCGSLEDAKKVLEGMPEKDCVSWNSMINACAANGMSKSGLTPNLVSWSAVIGGFSRNGYDIEAIEVLSKMLGSGMKPNAQTLASVLPACARLQRIRFGKELHGYIMRHEIFLNSFVVNGLMDMYRRCCHMGSAFRVFSKFSGKCAASYNTMIAGYSENGKVLKARKLFDQMREEGVEMERISWNSMISGALVEMYCKCNEIVAAQTAFSEVSERDLATWNALISGYARCNRIRVIGELLLRMKDDGFEPNVYTWNGIIAGYVENKLYNLAIKLFIEMQSLNLRPDIYTIGIVLAACSKLSTMERGKQVHAYSIRAGYDTNVYIGAALVDMYAKCGGFRYCYVVYNRISLPNLVSHNAMLTAYAMHGDWEEGIALFRQMLARKVRPDDVTFLSVLSLCVHVGSVEIGHECFLLMDTYNVTPTLKHYTCMVDLLSRAGKLKRAYELVKNMPMEADSVTWSALLGGCYIHSEVELGEIAAKKLIELEPHNTANYVLLANLYASVGRWHDLAQIRQLLKQKGMQKNPGCSWIEDVDGVHVFLAGDKSHIRSSEIYYTLDNLTNFIRTKHNHHL
ncbi:hypothetical protein Ahy_A06g030450 isoform A [Arachis hypogaea]|uniref:Pentatricopeptide repeat-containing protein n=1 Tax=Arachis hypogaea TaxID=3818 RepID=A0A445CWB3_ARAHY|nr:hypothetical protein Ahy_A06g030450 isoform A [Arachis hypogaea]